MIKRALLGMGLVAAGLVAFAVTLVQLSEQRNACDGGAICENWSLIKAKSE